MSPSRKLAITKNSLKAYPKSTDLFQSFPLNTMLSGDFSGLLVSAHKKLIMTCPRFIQMTFLSGKSAWMAGAIIWFTQPKQLQKW
jgi:hypothetical protein